METEIRMLAADDWEAVSSIYLAGIVTGQATFQTEAPTWEHWNNAYLPAPRLVATANETIVGWAALSPVSGRPAYAGVAEVSVYVDDGTRGQGVGSQLLKTLIAESERKGIWTLQASIFPENVASISLHRACGFREVGIRQRIGKFERGLARHSSL